MDDLERLGEGYHAGDAYVCSHESEKTGDLAMVSAARFIGGKIRGFRQDDWRYQVVVFTDNSLMPSVQ